MSAAAILHAILGAPNVRSKEWVIRQYDHEVQAMSVQKPLVGPNQGGPGDAAVIRPRPGRPTGIAVACGMAPTYGDLDPYAMAVAGIDEAMRNVVATGADPSRVALLDNFCWGNTDLPDRLGSLVRAAEACRDASLAYGTPFISGKDSLHNEFTTRDGPIDVPPSLLISSIAVMEDASITVSSDLKEAGNRLVLVGRTEDEMGGSHHNLVRGIPGGTVPQPRLDESPAILAGLHRAIAGGHVRAAHDLSEGGLGVAAAEMAFAGERGARLDLAAAPVGGETLGDETILFSESLTRFLVEVAPESFDAFAAALGDIPFAALGEVTDDGRLTIVGRDGREIVSETITDLSASWNTPLES